MLLLSSVQFSRSVMSDSLQSHELQHARPPCLSPTPGVHPDSRSLSQWCHPTISSSVAPFSSCSQSSPASGSSPVSQLFASGDQSVGPSASAPVLLMSIQGWFPFGLSPCSQRDWCPAPQFEGISSSVLSLFYCPALTSIYDYWKNHSFDYMDLCRQSNVSAFYMLSRFVIAFLPRSKHLLIS